MNKLIVVALTALLAFGSSGCVVTARPGVGVYRPYRHHHYHHHPHRHVVVVR